MIPRKVGFWMAVIGLSYLSPFAVKVLVAKTQWPPLVQFDHYVHGTGGA